MNEKIKNIKELINNIGRTIRLVWKNTPGLVILIVILSIIISFVPFTTSGVRAFLIDQLIATSSQKTITGQLGLAVGLTIVASFIPSILYTLQRYLGKLFWFHTDALFEMEIIKKRGELDVAVFENPELNDLLTRVNENGVWRLQNFTDRQFYLIQDILQVIIAITILSAFNPWLIVVLLAGTIPELIVEIKYGKDTWGLYGSKAETRRKFWNLKGYFEYKEGIVELRLFQNLRNFLDKIRNLFLDFQNEQRKLEKRKLIAQTCTALFSQIAVAAVIWWSVLQVISGHTLVGVFTFFLSSVGDFRSALSSFFQNLARQHEDSLFVSDIFKLFALETTLPKQALGQKLPNKQTPDVVFENVSFAYPKTKKLVLKNINLHIPAGHKIALVGINGSGKTTLVKLLCRFYDPTRGRILINGIDLRELDLESWYKQLGVLFQQYAQYKFQVSEAIAQGDSNRRLSIRDVKLAGVLSESDTFINSWPGKYKQMLGQEFTGGIDPSIGQWQKLALARVFYRNPGIFVLDEPTASIDAEAEAHIFERLEKVSTGKTLILISHRFSTVRRADVICVIKNGEIHEMGSHADLMAKDQTYAELFRLQAKGYE